MESIALIFQLALVFFIVTNAVGNSPAILALVKDFDFETQKKIMRREALFAFLLAIFFQYCGEVFLSALHIKDYALTLCGGILLFIVALNMIFHEQEDGSTEKLKREPFIVPIATPLLAGPGLLTFIMLKSQEVGNDLIISLAIIVSSIGVAIVLMSAPYLQRIFGTRGLGALEQLMGMLLAMLSMQMIVRGISLFLHSLTKTL